MEVGRRGGKGGKGDSPQGDSLAQTCLTDTGSVGPGAQGQ